MRTGKTELTHRVIPILLLCVVGFHLALASLWIRADVASPYWDEGWYLLQGAIQYDSLRSDGIAGWFQTWVSLERIRPPLLPTLTIPFFAVFGVSNDAGLLVNLFGLALLLVATYGLGTAIHSRRAGLLATLIVGSCPILVGLAHVLLVELTTVALVAATLLCLWRSDGFSDPGWSLAAGVLTGLGVLAKVYFVVFVAGPWLTVMAQTVPREDGQWSLPPPSQRRNLLLGSLVALAIACPWYVPNLLPMLKRSVDAAVGTDAAFYGPVNPLHWTNLLGYLLGFVGIDTSFLGFLAFLLGIAGLIAAKRRSGQDHQPRRSSARHPVVFLVSSASLGYLLFTSLRNQGFHHVAGVLPALAVLGGWGITELARRWWPAAASVAAVLMVGQAMLASFPGPFRNRELSVPILGRRLLLLYPARSWNLDVCYAAPSLEPWPTHEILSYALRVADLETLPHDRAKVGVIPDHQCMDPVGFGFESYRRSMPVVINRAYPHNLADQDVLLHKTGDLGWVWKTRVPSIEPVLGELAQPGSEFQLMPRTFVLPDGSEALIYARKPSPLLFGAPAPTYPKRIEFGGSARFLGCDVALEQAHKRTRTITITYYWESLAPTQSDCKVFVHFLDPETGNIVLQDDHTLFPRIYPTSLWQPGRFLFEDRTVEVPPSYSGAGLALRIGLYDEDGRLSVTVPAQANGGNPAFADVASMKLAP